MHSRATSAAAADTHVCAMAVLRQNVVESQADQFQSEPTGKHKASSKLCVSAAVSGGGEPHTSGSVDGTAGYKKAEGNSTLQIGAGQKSGQRKHMSLSLGVLQGREVENNDTFKYNEGFTAALFRIKINSIQLKETHEENKKTNDQVLQDRQYQVGA